MDLPNTSVQISVWLNWYSFGLLWPVICNMYLDILLTFPFHKQQLAIAFWIVIIFVIAVYPVMVVLNGFL